MMKRRKFVLHIFKGLLIFLTTMAPLFSSGQKLIFCERVSNDGKPINASSYFTIGEKGGYVQALVTTNRAINCHTATLDLFIISSDNKEIFENTITFEVRPEWLWFSKQITFYKKGDYVVYAYDEQGKLLGATKLKIRNQ